MVLSQKVLNIQKYVEESIANGSRMSEIIESELGVTDHNLSTIYTLKYYLEKEFDEYTDAAMQFLNSILALSGMSVDKIDKIKNFSEIDKEETYYNVIQNLSEHLRSNSGFATSEIASAVYDIEGNLMIGRKDVKRNKDQSLSMAVKSSVTIQHFLSKLKTDYHYMFNKERMKEIEKVLNIFLDNGYFSTSDSMLLVIGSKSFRNNRIAYTILGEEYVDDLTPDVMYCELKEITYRGCEFEAWVI